MSDRTTLSHLAELVAVDVASGQPGSHSQVDSLFLKNRPDFVVDLIVAGTARTQINSDWTTTPVAKQRRLCASSRIFRRP